MATTSFYLVPKRGTEAPKFTTVPPPNDTVILPRAYGDTNSIDVVIQLLQGLLPEVAAMADLNTPVAIRLDLITP